MAHINPRELDLRVMLSRLTHLATLINVTQLSGKPVTPKMFSDLLDLTREARALLHKDIEE